MYSIRKWLYKPKKEDTSVLAQFFYADEELILVATELDSFDGRKDPDRCTALVNQLRQCQDKVLNICNQIMDEVIPDQRANRDFRVKFPDDVLQENLAGQLWFGAECLAAGSSILNRELESNNMRPLAKTLTKTLDNLRNLMREQCLRNPHIYSDKIREELRTFDHLFAEFELSYVSAMVPVKSMKEYDIQQDLVVLFSETLQRALSLGLLRQEAVDDYDPALMFTIPRLAIVCGLLIYPEGPMNVSDPENMSEMFKPFQNLVYKIRDLLWTLNQNELFALEKTLCSVEDSGMNWEAPDGGGDTYAFPSVEDYVQKVYQDYPSCKQFITNIVAFISPRPASPTSGGESEPHVETMDSAPAVTAGDQEEEEVTAECDSGDCVSCGPSNETPDSLRTQCSKCVSMQVGNSTSPTSRNGSPTTVRRSRAVPLLRMILRPELANRSPARNCHGIASTNNSPSKWDDSVSFCSTDTSSYNSECQDDEEIALAMQAAEIASRQGMRARFKDSHDLVHRLFVCISGVADQLQTSNASDLRNILKCVFEMNCSQPVETPVSTPSSCPSFQLAEERVSIESAEEASEREENTSMNDYHEYQVEAPSWIPDMQAPHCMSCEAQFNLIRRRHHCRNCGKVFCGHCSSNFVPLPRFGLTKPVRVCGNCFMYHVTPFVISTQQD